MALSLKIHIRVEIGPGKPGSQGKVREIMNHLGLEKSGRISIKSLKTWKSRGNYSGLENLIT